MTTDEKHDDLGLGSKSSSANFRALNKDGSFNVKKVNAPFSERINLFHTLISVSWLRFLGFILTAYFIVNLIFATAFYFIGVEYLTGINATSTVDQFIEAFFFSAQTITTLGYGRVAPIGHLANTVAAIESMLGLLSFALATGLVYGRFSKSSATIKHSEKAVIAPYQEINAFMYKIVNPQSNHLLELEVNVSVSFRRKDSDLREFSSLKLERHKVAFLPYTWTIVHPIDNESPLKNMSAEELAQRDVEFISLIKAFDESTSQVVYSRSSYKAAEVAFGEKFVNVIQPEKDGMQIDISRLAETEKVELN